MGGTARGETAGANDAAPSERPEGASPAGIGPAPGFQGPGGSATLARNEGTPAGDTVHKRASLPTNSP